MVIARRSVEKADESVRGLSRFFIGASCGHARNQGLEALELVFNHDVAGFQQPEGVKAGRALGRAVAAAIGNHVATLRECADVNLTRIKGQCFAVSKLSLHSSS